MTREDDGDDSYLVINAESGDIEHDKEVAIYVLQQTKRMVVTRELK